MNNLRMRCLSLIVCLFALPGFAQDKPLDTLSAIAREDSLLRITNLNPYITLHVDSTLAYKFDLNRPDSARYFWYLRNSPVGLKINKDNGTLTFKADKSFFLSGKLRYDQKYNVLV